MVPVISVACRRSKTKNMLFSCVLACKCVRWGFNLQTCFTIYHWHTNYWQSDWRFLFLPSLFWGCLQFFSETNLWFLSFYVRAHGCFLYGWWSPATWTRFTRFTRIRPSVKNCDCNLNSQTTWLKVKLVNLYIPPKGMWGWWGQAVSPVQSSLKPCYKGPKLNYVRTIWICAVANDAAATHPYPTGASASLLSSLLRPNQVCFAWGSQAPGRTVSTSEECFRLQGGGLQLIEARDPVTTTNINQSTNRKWIVTLIRQ